jgi:hypothetical protein
MSKIIHKAISQGTIWPIIVHVSTGGKYVLISPKVLQRRRLPGSSSPTFWPFWPFWPLALTIYDSCCL